ncbi:MAG: hypothetical protein BIFFINMI_02122 [Phycisphaerae bacterium]|nr:hypothetical protein [Phycisphaerae bacterium]
MKHARGRLLAGLAAAFVAAIGFGAWRQYRTAPAIYDVEEDTLYACWQPGDLDWRRVRNDYHIRTVVLLTPPGASESGWKSPNLDQAERLGIRIIPLAMHEAGLTGELADRFMQIVADPDNRPVLVHSPGDSAFGGELTALYRMYVQSWSADKAMAELTRIAGSPPEPPVRQFLGDYRPYRRLPQPPVRTAEGGRRG